MENCKTIEETIVDTCRKMVYGVVSGYRKIEDNLFMARKFFIPTKPKKENLTVAEDARANRNPP